MNFAATLIKDIRYGLRMLCNRPSFTLIAILTLGIAEIGIRMAIGAQRWNVISIVVLRGMKLAFIGIALGLAGAWALTRVMGSLLFAVKSTDLVTLAFVILLLSLLALAASFVPARRATRIDPLAAVRYE
jgi:ABC-type antimicrobial peptide transport system permease subunit